MGLLITTTAVTSINDQQLQYPAQYIGVVISGAAAFSDIQAVKVKATIQGAKGTQPMIDEISLEHLMEMNTVGGGNYKTSASTIEGMIELSPDGALNFSTGSYLSITLTVLTAAMTVSLYALEAPSLSERFNRVLVRGLDTANTEKILDLAGSQKVGLIRSTTTQIRMAYPEFGRENTYLAKELDMISTHINEVVSVDNTGLIQNGYKNLYTVPCPQVKEFRIINNAITFMYIFTENKFGG